MGSSCVFAVNYVAGFLLTRLLPLLKASAPAYPPFALSISSAKRSKR